MTTTRHPKYPQRVRNELRFRELTVLRVERIGSAFQRVVLGGEALEGFVSQGFDDHTKLFFPAAGAAFTPPEVTDEGINWGDGVRPATRDYTPLYDAGRHELAYDFFIHDGGIACSWALTAKTGDKLVIGGPRGSLVVPEDYAWQLYVTDESSSGTTSEPRCAAVCWDCSSFRRARRSRRSSPLAMSLIKITWPISMVFISSGWWDITPLPWPSAWRGLRCRLRIILSG